MAETLAEALKKRVLVLDGAMGTEIQKNFGFLEDDYRGVQFREHGKDLKGNSDVLCMTQPDAIIKIHESYIEAGADIIETCTFGASRIVQQEYGLEGYIREMNIAAVKVAKTAADSHPERKIYVAGSIGPTSMSASTATDMENRANRHITFDELAESYEEQVDSLIEGGVDIILVETCFDTLNAKAAVYAINSCFERRGATLPVFVSGTIEISGRNLSGSDILSFYTSIMHCKSLFSVGLNCSLGPIEMMPYITTLSQKAKHLHVHAYPNAGMPDGDGNYALSPLQLKGYIRELITTRTVNIIGGCCGTTPEHIMELKELAKEIESQSIQIREVSMAKSDRVLALAGFNTVEAEHGKIISVGERCNVHGSMIFRKAIENSNYDKGVEIALKQVANGADSIDVNLDDSLLDIEREMGTFTNILLSEPEVAKKPLCIDSSTFEVLLAGLKKVPGRPLVNSISLQEGEKVFKERAKKLHSIGCVPVVMAFDEEGQGDTKKRKLQILSRSAEILLGLGFDESDFVVDPAVLPVATGIPEHDVFGVAFIETVEQFRKAYPRTSIIAGVSNISFALRGANSVRKLMHGLFIDLNAEKGLDCAIVNPLHVAPEWKRNINYSDVENVLDVNSEIYKLSKDILLNVGDVVKAREELLVLSEKASQNAQPQSTSAAKAAKEAAEKAMTNGERIHQAVVKGVRLSNLDEVLSNQLAELGEEPMKLVDNFLMPAIGEVGEKFGRGDIFLPQVLKSAFVMKEAFDFLLPKMNISSGGESSKRKRILLASVKGDIHNLGKRILAVILQCNNFEVKDIGESVDADVILNMASEWHADAVGLSGLINPSLGEMANVAKQMQIRQFTIPLLIGGAATSGEHTAVKIAPEYPSGIVVRVKDGSECVKVLSHILSPDHQHRLEYVSKIAHRHETLRSFHEERLLSRMSNFIPLEKARMAHDANIVKDSNWIGQIKIGSDMIGRIVEIEAQIGEMEKRFPWDDFFRNTFGLSSRNPESAAFKEAKLVEKDVRTIFAKFSAGKGLFAIFKAKVKNVDDIALYDGKSEEVATFYGIRRQQPRSEDGGTRIDCISECIPNGDDYVGVFAGTTGINKELLKAEFPAEPYWSILVDAVVNNMAESLSAYMHEVACVKNMGLPSMSGIRPAFGYQHQPDHSEKLTCWRLLDAEKRLGMTLTETYQMVPEASVSGLYFPHPEMEYFSAGRVGDDQISAYAKRKGISEELARKYLIRN